MAIATAVQQGGYVYAYDENGQRLFGIPFSDGPGEGLKGYTSDFVSIKQQGRIYIYDKTGRRTGDVVSGK